MTTYIPNIHQTTTAPPITNDTPAGIITPTDTTVASASKLEAYFLDVGQGDSEILRVGNSTMLIDAGTNASTNTLLSDIKGLGIRKFDVVIATHPHEDHIGGLDSVINQFPIGKIYMPKVTTTTQTFQDVIKAIHDKGLTVTTPVPGSTFNLGPDTCTILAPNSQSYPDLNSYSIVLRVVNGYKSFLFEGDAQTDSEKEMLAKRYTLKSDVLKVGHHGSDTSTSPDFLKAVSPKYAVIEVGAGNDYGHPHQVTLDKLNAAGVQIYRTDLNGIITITSDGSNLNVTTSANMINPATSVPTPTANLAPPSIDSTTPTIIPPPIITSPSSNSSPTLTSMPTSLPLTINIVSVTSPVNAGSQATLVAKTLPGAQCDITVDYKSGPSSASGLSPKAADGNGNISWTWTVGSRTTPGTWQIVVNASLNGTSISQSTSFTVQ